MNIYIYINKKTIYSFFPIQIFFGTFYSNDNHVDINAMYEGKAQIETDVNGKVSKLLLKHVTLRESRRIKCFVQIPGDTEGKTSDSTSLVVLGENVLIICIVHIIAHFAAFRKLCWYACGYESPSA